MKDELMAEIDDILLDYCTIIDCKETHDHIVLKHVVRERLEELVDQLLSPNE